MAKPKWDINGARVEALEHVLRCVMSQLRTKGLLDMDQLSADLETLGDETQIAGPDRALLEAAYSQQIFRFVNLEEPLDLDALP